MAIYVQFLGLHERVHFDLKHKRMALLVFLVEKRELLEIAKANAAKALGTDNIVLPASLKILTPSKETNNIKQEHEDSGESDEVSVNWNILD